MRQYLFSVTFAEFSSLIMPSYYRNNQAIVDDGARSADDKIDSKLGADEKTDSKFGAVPTVVQLWAAGSSISKIPEAVCQHDRQPWNWGFRIVLC